MYSEEIKQLLEYKGYLITAKEYLKILDTSPQINHIKLDCHEDNITIETDDRYRFVFKIRKENK